MLYLLDSQYTYMHIFALTLTYQYDLKAMIKPLKQVMDDGASRIAIGLIIVQHRPA